jgi:hypothetical protein
LTKIEINDVSLKGFTALLNYIYSGDKTIITRIQDLEELFELYHLAEKYFLTELKSLVSRTMLNFPFSVKNYAVVFTTVAKHENFLHTEKLCQDLLERCAAAVKTSWKTVDDCTGFWSADHNDDLALKGALCKRISMLGSRQFRSPDKLNFRNCKEGLHVRAANLLESVEGDCIPLGTRGRVHLHYLSDNSNRRSGPPYELYIKWDNLPDVRRHNEMHDIVCDD